MPSHIVLGIDPGPTMSGWAYLDTENLRPLSHGKTPNLELLNMLRYRRIHEQPDIAAIEMVASYGMPVGREVFTTVLWCGRFFEAIDRNMVPVELIERMRVKLHHCHSNRAGDATIRQALIDRFALGVRNHGKGTKGEPGWFYGFAADAWSAYALAVLVADKIAEADDVRHKPIIDVQLPGSVTEEPSSREAAS
jgi:hypothetical protein